MTSQVAKQVGQTVLPNWPVDPVVATVSALLLFTGFIMVASASTELSARTFGSPFHMLLRHGFYMVLALSAGFLALSIPVRVWQRLDWLLLIAGFLLLAAVLMPGIGTEVNGARRWISIGTFSVQGSEFVKLFAIVYLAGYLVRHRQAVQTTFIGFAIPLVLIVGLVALLILQPDFGAAVVIMASVMGVIFLAGVKLRYFVPIVIVSLVAGGLIAILQPYRLQRLTAFTDPWEHQFNGGYQLTQALIAFGRGEWFGLGLGNSIQKLFFLPEAHTDFLFSIIAEEQGVIGAVVIVGLFACLVGRGMWIGLIAENRGRYFHAYLAYGVALLLGIQAAINIGVNVGLLPTKGLTLPLISYGGNSLIVSCMFVALLLRVEFEVRREGETGPRTARGLENGR